MLIVFVIWCKIKYIRNVIDVRNRSICWWFSVREVGIKKGVNCMLKLYLGPARKGTEDRTKATFHALFNPEWMEDELVKNMVLDVDKSIVQSPYCIMSPVLGQIPPDMLSGGVKFLILMLKTDLRLDLSKCGENCAKWVIEIAKHKDVEADLNYFMPLDPNGDEVYIVNDESIVTAAKGILKKEACYL